MLPGIPYPLVPGRIIFTGGIRLPCDPVVLTDSCRLGLVHSLPDLLKCATWPPAPEMDCTEGPLVPSWAGAPAVKLSVGLALDSFGVSGSCWW